MHNSIHVTPYPYNSLSYKIQMHLQLNADKGCNLVKFDLVTFI